MNSDVYRSLQRELENGKKAVVITVIDEREGKRESLHNKTILTEEQLDIPNALHNLDTKTDNKARFALKTGILQYFKTSNNVSVLIEPYFPKPHLIVLGGGNIAKPLVEFGSKVGFLVTVVDDRPMFANRDRFPDAEKIIFESFSHCFEQFQLTEYSFVVIVTREHRHDLDCLKQALNYKTAYIGLIGSKRSVNHVKGQLLNEGYPDELINKINAPIGLKIGAITPEEIAISIIAQVIRCRRSESKSEDNASAKANWPELDSSVLKELSKEMGDPKALVTIVATKGPVPGKTGTKMLVWPYGMTMGSIGGGYAEGEVINAAWQIIGSGGAKIHDINMAGQIAEEEGMVCGGVMQVLIEDYNG